MTRVNPRPDSGEHLPEGVARILRESPSAPDFTVAERRGAATILDEIAQEWASGPARSAVLQAAEDLRDPGLSLPAIAYRIGQALGGAA